MIIRVIATCLNAVAIAIFTDACIRAEDGVNWTIAWPLVPGLLVCPVVNLLAIWLLHPASAYSVYCERRRLEALKRIAELKREVEQDH